ncbi:hypothetical protein ACQP3J_31240, partial [Escherichia coli]
GRFSKWAPSFQIQKLRDESSLDSAMGLLGLPSYFSKTSWNLYFSPLGFPVPKSIGKDSEELYTGAVSGLSRNPGGKT